MPVWMAAVCLFPAGTAARQRLNIFWVIYEDICANLGC